MVPVKSITITRAEGLTVECDKPVTVGTFTDADIILRRWSNTAPEHGGYNKCDFTVVYEDGETYGGRYDLMHWRREMPSIANHMKRFLECYAGRWRPNHFKESHWQHFCKTNRESGTAQQCEKFLDNYQIGD